VSARVWVVSVEYMDSGGETPFAVVGVFRNEAAALAEARAQAEGYLRIVEPAEPTIVLAGELFRGTDAVHWDLWITVDDYPLEGQRAPVPAPVVVRTPGPLEGRSIESLRKLVSS
jgi:hypothetical protein